jgi:alanine dehydrogenase
MLIGVPKEIKDNENRVGLTPAGARRLIAGGNRVLVESGAGGGCGFPDADYAEAGAEIAGVDRVWNAELVVKVKEPLESEYPRLGDQMLFTYLHLAGVSESLTDTLLERGTTAVAYETVEDADGRLPLLAPMSAVAGCMAPIVGNYYLARFNSGRGTLLGWLLGQRHGQVVIVGDGFVGRHAAQVAAGMGAGVTMLGLDEARGRAINASIDASVDYVISTPESVAAQTRRADLVVGAVLLEGARAPRVVTEAMVEAMPDGAVIVDVSIDQGGCVETSQPTSHSSPTFIRHGVVHYCVTNMPGAYPRTSTIALTDATLPCIERIAARGLAAFADDPGLGHGVNTLGGYLTCEPVAAAFDRRDRFRPLASLLRER